MATDSVLIKRRFSVYLAIDFQSIAPARRSFMRSRVHFLANNTRFTVAIHKISDELLIDDSCSLII